MKVKNPSCLKFETMIWELHEVRLSELSDGDRLGLNAHLAECESCRSLHEEEAILTGLLSSKSNVISELIPSLKVRAERLDAKSRSQLERNDVKSFPAKSFAILAASIAIALFSLFAFQQFFKKVDSNSPLDQFRASNYGSEVTDRLERDQLTFGLIKTRPVISQAVFVSSTKQLEAANHIELPAGAIATIELHETGVVTASGPVVFEIDRIENQWKITLLSGRLKVFVKDQQAISVAGANGAELLEVGDYQLDSEAEVFARPLKRVQDRDDDIESTQNDSEKSPTELYEEAMRSFQGGSNSTSQTMARSAELLKRVVDHSDTSQSLKFSASFYLAAAYLNSNQPEESIKTANSVLEIAPKNYDQTLLGILCEAHVQLGQVQQARAAYERLAESSDDDSWYTKRIENLVKQAEGKPTDSGKRKKSNTPERERSQAKKRNASWNQKELDELSTDTRLKVEWTVPLASPSFGGAAVADVDGDGKLEIAFGTYFDENAVVVLNSEDGSELWRYDAGYACLDASVRFFDLDSDGGLELLVPISNKGQMISFEAKTGEENWIYQPSPTECTDSPSTILDLDGDGKYEFVYGTFLGKLHVVDAETGKEKRTYKVCDHPIQTAPTVIDLNDDQTLDFVCADFKGDNKVYAIDGSSGKRIWEFHVPGDHIGMYHGCSVGDLDNDGNIELTIGAYDGKVYCLNAVDGKKNWEVDNGEGYIMSPTVICDLNGDGNSEVIVVSQKVTVIDSKGQIKWSKRIVPPNTWDAATRGASVADLNGDGRLDIASLTGEGKMFVHSGDDGRLLYYFDSESTAEYKPYQCSHGITIADFNGDAKLDMFFVVGATKQDSKQGLAICLTGFDGKGPGWYMLRHDPQSTGNLDTPIAPSLLKFIEQ